MRNKFNAKKTTVDGIVFDSKREAARYVELRDLERAGKIRGLRRQVRFELLPAFNVDGKHYRPTTYIADFTYIDAKTGKEIVEDVKGVKTPIYRMKSKLFAYRYQRIVKETW